MINQHLIIFIIHYVKSMNVKNHTRIIFGHFIYCIMCYVALAVFFTVADIHGFLKQVIPHLLLVLAITIFFTWQFVRKTKQIIEITQV